MDWMDAIRARLLADGPLIALLPDYTPTGSTARKTVFWDDRPQGSPIPAVLLTVVGGVWSQHMKGFNQMVDRVQVDGYGRTSKEARAVALAAFDSLIGPFTQSGHDFSRADVALTPRGLAERVGSTTLFRVSMDLSIYHSPNDSGS